MSREGNEGDEGHLDPFGAFARHLDCQDRGFCYDANMNKELPPRPAEPKPGLYRHYKNNPYRVTGLALHSETREWLVVYEALYGEGGLFVRPAAMFTELVEVEGKLVPRFVRVE